jgi:hypothetical protein
LALWRQQLEQEDERRLQEQSHQQVVLQHQPPLPQQLSVQLPSNTASTETPAHSLMVPVSTGASLPAFSHPLQSPFWGPGGRNLALNPCLEQGCGAQESSAQHYHPAAGEIHQNSTGEGLAWVLYFVHHLREGASLVYSILCITQGREGGSASLGMWCSACCRRRLPCVTS